MSAQIDCPVCLNAITGLVNCATTICGHKFHATCLVKCVSHNGFNCPYCRSNMANDNEGPVRAPVRAPVREEDDLPDIVRKMEFNGIKYLVSRRTGKVFDYIEYIQNCEQIEVGRFNSVSQQIELFA